jgi:hypothetical protein
MMPLGTFKEPLKERKKRLAEQRQKAYYRKNREVILERIRLKKKKATH